MPKLFEGVLILSDVDNTFLGKSSRIVPENVEAIESFKTEGGLFSFATGRDPYALDVVIPDADKIANFPSIVSNGAYLYDFATGGRCAEDPLDKALFLPILRAVLRAFPTVGMRISTKDCFLCPNSSPEMLNNLKGFAHITRMVPFDKLPQDEPFYKCVFHADPETLLAVRALVAPLAGQSFALSTSSATLFEILDKEATKGKKIASLRSLSPAPLIVYGVGDWENDMELLRLSDVPCAPENAMDCIKELSQIRLCHHDRGAIADLIAKLTLLRR